MHTKQLNFIDVHTTLQDLDSGVLRVEAFTLLFRPSSGVKSNTTEYNTTFRGQNHTRALG
jgi:hypothetical protein